MVLKHNRKQYILSLVVGVAVAVPVLTLPIGVRAGIRPALAVSNAYKNVFGITEEYGEFLSDNEQVVIEDWAIVDDVDPVATPTPDETDDQPQEVVITGSYEDVPKYTVFQAYDSASNLPIELLDPQYFAADDTQYYVKTRQVLLKQEPDMTSVTIRMMNIGEGVRRIGIGDTWSKIRTDEGLEGYVLTSTLSVEMVWTAIYRNVWVDTGNLTLRAEPSTQSEVVATLYDEQHLVADASCLVGLEELGTCLAQSPVAFLKLCTGRQGNRQHRH